MPHTGSLASRTRRARARQGLRRVSAPTTLVALAVGLAAGVAAGGIARAEAWTAVNGGLLAAIHDAGDIESRWLVHEDGRLWFRHPTAGEVELLTGPGDPRLPRAGVTAFQPLAAAPVTAALESITGIAPQLTLDVFLLPAPPVTALGSFARRAAIFLSPAWGPVSDQTVAALVTHELGHVLTWAYLDGHPRRWDEYCELRGLSREAGGPEAPHAQRVREILAEDVRVLFGGALARGDGAVENHDLTPPQRVEGLAQLLAADFAGAPGGWGETARTVAFPTPASAGVVVELLPAAVQPAQAATSAEPAAAELAVYDVRGRLVRRLAGGSLENGRLLWYWDGRDAGGRLLAAGRYPYVARWGAVLARGSLILVR